MNQRETPTTTPVAVLMAVYGRDDPSLFKRALESIAQQDYADGPIHLYLCVDGPVTPEIASVLRLGSERIYRLVRNESNIGLARSLNRLIDMLEQEEFVFRMDSDDVSHTCRFTRQVQVMRMNPQIDVLGAAINEVDRAGRLLNTIRYPKAKEEVVRYVTRRNPLAHPTVCFRRRAIERFKHYPEVPINQDWALWFECLRIGLVLSNIDDVLVDMTATEGFFRRRGATRALQEFRILTSGISRLYGPSWRYVFPVLRLAFRLAPRSLIKLAYRSGLR